MKVLGKQPDEKTVDYLCLHLGFYLGSWGMNRNSFLLWKDYRVHKDVVTELLNEQYLPLWAISCDALLLKENLCLLFQLAERIKDIYVHKRENYDGGKSVSKTLITKVLMGTLGCVPAYDQFLVHSITKLDVAIGEFKEKSIRNLAGFYVDHKPEFEACRDRINSQGLEYPPMKILDMAFWQMGNKEIGNAQK